MERLRPGAAEYEPYDRAVNIRRIGVALAAVACAGCGGGHRDSSQVAAGHKIFAGACAYCHTLTGHDTQINGGDLGDHRFSLADLESFTRVMPVRPRLTARQSRAVAAYVRARESSLAP